MRHYSAAVLLVAASESNRGPALNLSGYFVSCVVWRKEE
jgi:hypothetical protein